MTTRPRFSHVVALYVDPHGPYQALVGDCYDFDRDARTYHGDRPVVAHPPCGPWGRYAHRCRQDRNLAIHAVETVRRVGGVVEHPITSRLWAEMEIPSGDWSNPSRRLDPYGGYTMRLLQINLGHRAIKSTAIYVCGSHRLPAALAACQEHPHPHPVERMGHTERRLTPVAPAYALVLLASWCAETP